MSDKKCKECGIGLRYDLYKGLCTKCNMEKQMLENYEAYKKLIKNGKASDEIKQEFNKTRKKIIDRRLEYLKSLDHLKNCKITLELVHNHPIIRIDRPTGYDYGFIFEEEIFEDSNWIGHCSSCLKPIFKGEKGYSSDGQYNLGGLSWRGCEECSTRNGHTLKVF